MKALTTHRLKKGWVAKSGVDTSATPQYDKGVAKTPHRFYKKMLLKPYPPPNRWRKGGGFKVLKAFFKAKF